MNMKNFLPLVTAFIGFTSLKGVANQLSIWHSEAKVQIREFSPDAMQLNAGGRNR
jgi:hypothetical protein